jgi:hypothetical protein
MIKVINDSFNFCWTSVCAIDPDYEQYCTEGTEKMVTEIEPAAIPETITPLRQLLDQRREERGLEPLVRVDQIQDHMVYDIREEHPEIHPAQPVPIGLQPANDDIPVDPPDPIDPKLKEREYYDWGTGTTKYYTDEEYEVLKEVSGGNIRGTSVNWPIGEINPLPVNREGLMDIDDVDDEIAKQKAKMEELRIWSRKIKLNPEIEERNKFAGNPYVMALPPPKTILVSASYVWQDDRSVYVVYNHDRDIRTFVDFFRYSVKRSAKDGKLRYCSDSFIGGRKKGFIRQTKTPQQRVVYNTRTKCLYMFIVNKDAKKKKDIRCANFMHNPTVGCNSTFTLKLHNLFIKDLLEIVKVDVPDVVTWNDGKPESASFIVFQHRYNKAVKWIDREMWNKICESIRIKPFIVGDEKDTWGRPVQDNKKRSKGMRKFHKIFKQFTNYTGLVKALFQEGYRKSYLDLFSRMDSNTLSGIHLNMMRNGCSQTLYNFMLEIFKGTPIEFNRGGQYRIRINHGVPMTFLSVTEDSKNYPHLIELWVKLCRRFITENGAGMDWHIFKDTMLMAEQYHLRVRINKFKSQNDVYELHDKLQGYKTRDINAMMWFKKTTIQPFTYPDKEYDGYKFVFLDTAQKIVDEGTAMRHCCGSYTNRCMSGHSLLFSMRKGDRGYVTIELNGETLNISQKHTIGNNSIINEHIDMVIKRWHNDVVEMHINDKTSYQQIAEEFNKMEKEKLQKQYNEEHVEELKNQMQEIAQIVEA